MNSTCGGSRCSRIRCGLTLTEATSHDQGAFAEMGDHLDKQGIQFLDRHRRNEDIAARAGVKTGPQHSPVRCFRFQLSAVPGANVEAGAEVLGNEPAEAAEADDPDRSDPTVLHGARSLATPLPVVCGFESCGRLRRLGSRLPLQSRLREGRGVRMTWRTGAFVGALLTVAVSYGSPPVAYAEDERASRQHVMGLLRDVPLIDGHNDVPWQYRTRVSNHLDRIDFRDTSALEPPMHTDLVRLRQGGVGAQFWSVYIPTSFGRPGAARVVFEQVDLTKRLIERYADDLELALTADDIERIHGAGKVASLLGAEGGHSIESSSAY